MTIAGITATFADGGLGAARSLARPPAIVGCSSGGTVDTPALIGTVEDAISTFGYGKLVELIALYLALAGGPVVAVKAASTTAGSCSAVTPGSSNTSTAVMTVTTGTARDDLSVKFKVTRAGANLAALTAAVRISYDGGLTYAEEVAVPADGAFTLGNTGIVADFTTDGTFVVDDTFSFTATAPIWSTGALGTALDSLEITSYDHEFVHVAEHVLGSSISTLNDSISSLEASGIYRWHLSSARGQNVAGSESVSTWTGILVGASPGFSAYTSRHGVVCAGEDIVPSPITGVQHRRQVAWMIGPRLALVRAVSGGAGLAEHPGRVKSGPVAGGKDLSLYHDLRTLTTLDSNRFAGLQSLSGRAGYFATARSSAADGSDYTSVMNIRVMKEAARVATLAAGEYLNENVRTITGGKIDPRDADAIDAYVTRCMQRDMVDTGYASTASASVTNTTHYLLRNSTSYGIDRIAAFWSGAGLDVTGSGTGAGGAIWMSVPAVAQVPVDVQACVTVAAPAARVAADAALPPELSR